MHVSSQNAAPATALRRADPGQSIRSWAELAARFLGAVSLLAVGAVHLQQYEFLYSAIPTIGTLFLLNFAGATLIGLGLLLPGARMRPLHLLLALGGIGLSATAFVFLFVSEHQPLFGFQDYGYRTEIVVALAAETAAVVTLGAYLAVQARRRF
jgi:hypothetical protein